MSLYHWQRNPPQTTRSDDSQEDEKLRALGYSPSFRRGFSYLATIGFAFGNYGICSSIAITFNTPLLLGGPASVSWCWLLGGINCIALASCVAEIVSAYPTCGGLYGASAHLSPEKYRAKVGWITGWLTIIAQIVGLSSVESGLANMILAGVSLSTHGAYVITPGKLVGLTASLLVVHALLNSLKTRYLALFANFFMFINVVLIILVIILLLAMTPRSEMHAASYVFGSQGLINGTGGWSNGISFLLGLLSVQWTLSGYDVTAHISEELHRASSVAPAAIMIATTASMIFGWILNIVLVLCSGPFADLPGPSGSAFLTVLVLRLGRSVSIALWVLVCMSAWYVGLSGIQAASRTVYAFSRDHGLPDRGFLGHINEYTKTPLRSVWLTAFCCFLPALLYLASSVAANAVFAMSAMASDVYYVIPVIVRRLFHSHPEVNFQPGPYYMGNGWFGAIVNVSCTFWMFLVCAVLSLPTILPVTASNMNYAAPINAGIITATGLWFLLSAHRHYHGPPSGVDENSRVDDVFEKSTDGGSASGGTSGTVASL